MAAIRKSPLPTKLTPTFGKISGRVVAMIPVCTGVEGPYADRGERSVGRETTRAARSAGRVFSVSNGADRDRSSEGAVCRLCLVKNRSVQGWATPAHDVSGSGLPEWAVIPRLLAGRRWVLLRARHGSGGAWE